MQRQAPASLSNGDGVTDVSERNLPSKNAKSQHADSEEADTAAASDADPEITLCVACLDGSSLDLKVSPRELVREVKRSIGQVRRLACDCVDLLCLRSHSWGHAIPARRHCGVCQRPSLPFPTRCCLHRRATWTRA